MQVPTYDAPQEQLRPVADVAVQAARPGDAALALGQGAESAGAAGQAVAMQAQHQRDADQLFQSEASIKDAYTQFESSLSDRVGTRAWGVAKDTGEWWDKAISDHAGTLENDTQRRLFTQNAQRLRSNSLESATKFEDGQRRAAVEDSAKASIVQSINLAAADFANPATVASAKDDVTKRIQVMAGLGGWTPERRAAEEQQYVTQLHTQVLQNMVDKDSAGAQAYYDAHKAEIAGTARDGIEKVLKVGAIKERSQAATDEIMGKGLTESQALAEARKRFSGEDEDAVVQRISARYAEREQAKNKAERDTSDAAWNAWSRGGMDSIPAHVLANLDGKTLHTLHELENAKVAGSEIKTDWSTYADLRDMARGYPAEFAARDLRQYRSQLGNTEFKQLIDLQEAVQKPESRGDAATLGEQVRAVSQNLKLNKVDTAQFESATYQAIDAEATRLGRKPTFKERQEIVDRMAIQGSKPGMFWSHDARGFQVVGTPDVASFTPKDVPADERVKIEAALKRAGQPVTDASVLQLYTQKVRTKLAK
jgi:hypothetical protein